jgi:excisionase family DNA binding protein
MLDEKMERLLRKPSCTVPEVAALFSLSRSGVYDAIERGEFKAIRFGAKYVIPTLPLRKMLLLEENSSAISRSVAA